MKLTNKESSKLKREEIGKITIKRMEEEILELKGEQREEQMKAYRKLLSSTADQLVYFERT